MYLIFSQFFIYLFKTELVVFDQFVCLKMKPIDEL